MLPHQLITVYNRVTQRLCGLRGTFPLKHSKTMLEAADAYLSWCREQAVDPTHFILLRHDAIRWCRRIPIRELTQVNGDFIDRFEWKLNRYAAMEQDKRDSKRVKADTDRRKSLTVLGETMKATLAPTPEACLGTSLESMPLTGGWHPASVWCQACRRSEQCRQALPPGVESARETA